MTAEKLALEKQLQETPSELESLSKHLLQREAELKEKDARIGDLTDESYKLSEQANATELRLKKIEEMRGSSSKIVKSTPRRMPLLKPTRMRGLKLWRLGAFKRS